MRVAGRAGVHHLKCWPEPFAAVLTGAKRYELRVNDRDFRVGDLIVLHEWVPAYGALSGRWFAGRVTHAIFGPRVVGGIPHNPNPAAPWESGLAERWCALGFRAVRDDQELPKGGLWSDSVLHAVAGRSPRVVSKHRVTKVRRAGK